MGDAFLAFLGSPSRDTYLAAREAIVKSDRYEPYSRVLEVTAGQLSAGEYHLARESILAAMSNLVLSPTAHLLLSIAADKIGDQKGAQIEREIATTCFKGILTTGDGSRTNPYLIVRISDEYDVVLYLGTQLKEQSLVLEGGKNLDHVVCVDGSEFWFDITDAFDRSFMPDLFRARERQEAGAPVESNDHLNPIDSYWPRWCRRFKSRLRLWNDSALGLWNRMRDAIHRS
jgi:hypothetical protein